MPEKCKVEVADYTAKTANDYRSPHPLSLTPPPLLSHLHHYQLKLPATTDAPLPFLDHHHHLKFHIEILCIEHCL